MSESENGEMISKPNFLALDVDMRIRDVKKQPSPINKISKSNETKEVPRQGLRNVRASEKERDYDNRINETKYIRSLPEKMRARHQCASITILCCFSRQVVFPVTI